jgi:FkbM family methyltransferase
MSTALPPSTAGRTGCGGEPQPAAVKVLRLFYGRNSDVTIEPVAVGRATGTISMMVNPDNPTVSTASHEIVRAARDAPGWEAQRWTRTIRVPVTTLDSLIARHGMPTFIKIDVEGFELEVLAGLSRRSRRCRLNSLRSNATSHLIAWSAVSRSVLAFQCRAW